MQSSQSKREQLSQAEAYHRQPSHMKLSHVSQKTPPPSNVHGGQTRELHALHRVKPSHWPHSRLVHAPCVHSAAPLSCLSWTTSQILHTTPLTPTAGASARLS
mmetsp:Transcript_9062/g.29772  ORF Transcript_9062/g.29772 Transcript_9062/m.29772 type:complete len:103 (+) Transcript_9062:547-855(+)